MPSLILCDTDHVKHYVFSSYKLREVRGASAILDHLNRVESEALLQGVEGGSCLYSFGGATMGRFSSPEKASDAIRRLEKVYRERSAGAASITGAQIDWDGGEGEPFRAARRELALRLRLAKDGRPARAEATPSLGLLRFCRSCGGFPATYLDPPEQQPLCRACHYKRQRTRDLKSHDDRVRERVSPILLDELQKTVQRLPEWARVLPLRDFVPDDLNDIGALSTPRNYLGFIYIDANSLGQLLQCPGTVDTLQKLARGVDQRLREVTFSAIAKLLQPAKKAVLPFEIILLGGDDLVLVTVADKALRVAQKILQDFVVKPIEGEKLSLSAAVILAHDSFPMASFFRLASEALRLAKRRRAEGEAKFADGAIEFVVVSSSGAQNLSASREEWKGQTVGAERTLWLTARPYSIADFAHLRHSIRQLKAVRFPRSRLHYLYESLFRSLATSEVEATIAATEVLGRLGRADAQKALRTFFDTFSCSPLPWQIDRRRSVWTTPLLDLVELWDFVPVDEPEEV